MKKTIPEREIEVCDVCEKNERCHLRCICCGGMYCDRCEALIGGRVTQTRVCKKCGDRKGVQVIVQSYGVNFTRLLDARAKELREFYLNTP